MQSQTILKDNKGFTIIEIIVVIGLIVAILAFGSIFDINSFSRELARGETSTLVSVLNKARSKSMNNLYNAPHGVYIDTNDFVIFRTSSYNPTEPTNEKFPRNTNVAISGMNSVIFERLSGEPNTTGVFTLSDGTNTKTIEIKSSGLIEW